MDAGLRRLKALDIPIIASLNGTTLGGWVEYSKLLEEAGADALELNVYYVFCTSRGSAMGKPTAFIPCPPTTTATWTLIWNNCAG
ncbi:MAG: hypothetical protein LC646_09770 [Xanthomonadaceae bacterium]|nr:hypothetical protein [Xanthomonadaceae bacterium]